MSFRQIPNPKSQNPNLNQGTLCCLLFLLAVLASPAEAAVADYLGRTIAEVRIRSQRAEIQDPSLLELIETRPGTPLTMPTVRETIVHLFSLGRFEDVGVDADLRGDGVVLIYDLVPALRVARIEFRGVLGLRDAELRRTVVERYGASPPPARGEDAARALLDLYLERGYRRAEVRPRVEATGRPDRATLVFDVRAGDPGDVGRVRGARDGPAAGRR
jgi:outer membrane protein assembly factor BamA